jgi:hypothetical protein
MYGIDVHEVHAAVDYEATSGQQSAA